ncbi:unnamed protein product [Ectocarpus sp. 12 AP-2014]
MASSPSVYHQGKHNLFTQRFRKIDAIRTALRTAVAEELAQQTEERRREAYRVNAENKRRSATAAAVALDGKTDSSGIFPGSDSDGYSSEVSISVPCGLGRDGTASRTRSASSSSGSRGGRAVSRPRDRQVEPLSTAACVKQASTSPDMAFGVRVDSGDGASGVACTSRGRRDGHDQGPTPPTAVAASVSSESQSVLASAGAKGGGAKTGVRFLEDILRLGPKGSRSNAAGRALPNPKRKSHPRPGGCKGEASRTQTHKKPRQGTGAVRGPFSGLSLCVVHLGTVTSNTIKTFKRGVCDGGGHVSTRFTPGDTTHIVADASLAASWEKLDNYLSGWGGVDDLDGAVNGGRLGLKSGMMPEGVPIVSNEWMSECLRRSAVVATDAYRLIPPPHRSVASVAASPAAAARRQQRSSTPANQSIAAGGGTLPTAAAAAAGHVGLASSTRLAAARNEVQGGSTQGTAGESTAAADLESMAVKGGFGARNPDVGKKRHTFHCQSTTNSRGHAANSEAADMLEDLAKLCAVRGGDGSVFRERGFKNAAGVLRRLGVQITNIQQLKDLRKHEPQRVRGLGDSVMKELSTFYEEGRMHRLDGLEADPKLKCLKIFQEVGWVGAVKAQQLYDKGMRSIEDLRTKGLHLLSEQAQICLDRHEDITQRMPRSEAAEIEAVVTRVAQSICPGVICQACGSYRRGKSHCGDVDVLIRPPEGQEDSPMFDDLIKRLVETGFITDKLTLAGGPHRPGKSQSFMGICKLPGKGRLHRRVDIKFYPTSLFAFAVLYFTGSSHFNRSMRSFAKIKGLKLSDKGLCRVNTVNGEEVHRFPSYSCLREEDVFTALGLEWREPKDRDGVQVQAFCSKGEGGATELSGRVVPVTLEQEQQHQALLEQERLEASDYEDAELQQQE